MTSRLLIALVALALGGCSPLLGLIVRAAESGDAGELRVGEPRSGNTRGAADRHSPTCAGGGDAGDDSYVFVPETSGTYRVDLNGGYDCVVSILDDSGETVACNDDTGETSHSQVEAALEAGRRYTVVVDGYRDATGTYTVRVDALTLDTPPPAGNALAVGQERPGDTRNQTDHRTPPCGSTPGSPDEVWTFTPPEDGSYQIDTTSDYDGTLAVYAPGQSEPIACNDDEGSTRASRVNVQLSAGTAYEVVVDGYHGSVGSYRIGVTQTGSGTASQVLTAGTPVRGDTRGQSDTRTPGCGSRAGSPDQTWTFTATQSGPLQLHVDAEYDSVLAVYEQGGSNPIQCNDDFQGTRMSRLTVPVVQGHTYEVVVDGYGGASGAYMLRATQVTSSGGGPIQLDQQVSGNTSAGNDTRTPTCGSRSGSPDETWTFVAPSAGMFRFHVDGDFDSVVAVYLNGAQLACNDDHGSTRASRVEASLQAGQRVEVVVDGFQGGAGGYRLRITNIGAPVLPVAPAGIENINALELRCGGAPQLTAGRLTAQVRSATAHARVSCGGGGGGGEALYRIQVQRPTVLTVSATSPAGPVLELRRGCSRGHTVLSCNGDDPRANLQARLEPGRQYTLVVDSRSASDADVTLDVQLNTP